MKQARHDDASYEWHDISCPELWLSNGCNLVFRCFRRTHRLWFIADYHRFT